MEGSSRLEEVSEGWWSAGKTGIGCEGADSVRVQKGKRHEFGPGFVLKTLRIVHFCRTSQTTSTCSEGLCK